MATVREPATWREGFARAESPRSGWASTSGTPSARTGGRTAGLVGARSCRAEHTPTGAATPKRAACPASDRSRRAASGSDVVHRRAGVAVLALDDVVDGRLGEHGPCGGRRFGEDRLGAGSEGAVEELDDLEDRDVGGIAGEGVPALDAALRAQDARAAQDREELLQELHGDVATAGELADGDGRAPARAAHAGELGQGADGVRRLGRDREHGALILPPSPAPCAS